MEMESKHTLEIHNCFGFYEEKVGAFLGFETGASRAQSENYTTIIDL